jgi:tRNA pseudouridine55 synthase
MPKVSFPPLPLSGLFAVAKPSGPTSMSLVNDLKEILTTSRLFADTGKATNKGKKQGKRRQNALKIGQGGTLDPLADGVLGECLAFEPAC